MDNYKPPSKKPKLKHDASGSSPKPTGFPTRDEDASSDKAAGLFASGSAAPGKESKVASPGKESKEASPGKESKEASPGKESKEASPGKESKEASPGKESKEVSPGKESKEAPPGHETKEDSFDKDEAEEEHPEFYDSPKGSSEESWDFSDRHVIGRDSSSSDSDDGGDYNSLRYNPQERDEY